MTRDKPEEAKALIEKAIAANPGSTRPRLALIGYYTRQRRCAAALTAGTMRLKHAFPTTPSVLDALGKRAARRRRRLIRRLADLQQSRAVAAAGHTRGAVAVGRDAASARRTIPVRSRVGARRWFAMRPELPAGLGR